MLSSSCIRLEMRFAGQRLWLILSVVDSFCIKPEMRLTSERTLASELPNILVIHDARDGLGIAFAVVVAEVQLPHELAVVIFVALLLVCNSGPTW